MPESEQVLFADHNKPVDLLFGLIFLSGMLCNPIYFFLVYSVLTDAPLCGLAFFAGGILGVWMFGWAGFWYLHALFEKDPAFVMTREGVYDSSEPWSPGWVCWSEVKCVKARRILFWKVVIFELHNRSGIIARQTSFTRRTLFKTRLPFSTDEVYVRLNTLTKPMIGELLRRVDNDGRNIPLLLE